MSHVSGDGRTVPKRQREVLRGKIDNFIDNSRYRGDPNRTDETDVFDELYKEDDRINKELRDRQSIQRWNR